MCGWAMIEEDRTTLKKLAMPDLPPNEMRLAVFLLAHHNPKERPDLPETPEWGCCWVSSKVICRELKLSKVTLSRAKKGLVKKGILRVATVNRIVNQSPKWLTPALTLSYHHRQPWVNSTVNPPTPPNKEEVGKEGGREDARGRATTTAFEPQYLH